MPAVTLNTLMEQEGKGWYLVRELQVGLGLQEVGDAGQPPLQIAIQPPTRCHVQWGLTILYPGIESCQYVCECCRSARGVMQASCSSSSPSNCPLAAMWSGV